MKTISLINSHVAVWSFLRGDHALLREVKLISPKLLDEPNFLDPLENKIRLEVFKHKRNWIYENMGENASLALVKFTMNELKNFTTCFSEITLGQYYKEHKKTHKEKTDFLIRRSKVKTDIKKSMAAVEKEFELKEMLLSAQSKVNKNDVLDCKQGNEENLLLATNRCWIMGHNGKNTIVDGNHRLTAYYWAKKTNKKNKLPNELFCFYFMLNRQ